MFLIVLRQQHTRFFWFNVFCFKTDSFVFNVFVIFVWVLCLNVGILFKLYKYFGGFVWFQDV